MKKLLSTMLIILLGTQVSAQNYHKGIEAYENKNYALAVFELIPIANQGHLEAQKALGYMFYAGLGVPVNYAKAHKWFLLAANQGNNFAQFTVGAMYDFGDGIARDSILGHMWYKIASLNGYPLDPVFLDPVAKQLSPNELNDAEVMARECVATNYEKCGY
ncbi:tetratricopeptide repeat protein [Amylibacter sp.]|nr:tetratricopeptide repeat protein [Amylibacter sp.]